MLGLDRAAFDKSHSNSELENFGPTGLYCSASNVTAKETEAKKGEGTCPNQLGFKAEGTPGYSSFSHRSTFIHFLVKRIFLSDSEPLSARHRYSK